MNDYAIRMAAYVIQKYKTRNPYDIIAQRKINFSLTPRLIDTLGFYAVVDNRRFIRISSYANELEQLMGATHELGHDIHDRREAARSGPFQDTFFYSLDTTVRERRANLFSAELLIADNSVLEPCGYYEFQERLDSERKNHPHATDRELLYYIRGEMEAHCTTEEIARSLGLDPVLVEFKYQALKEKGYELPIEPNLDSRYLTSLMARGKANDYHI